MGSLGPLVAVEYAATAPGGEDAVVYRHEFAASDPVSLDPGARPVLAYSRTGSLRVRGGEYTVDEERGIMERVEALENPRKKRKRRADGRFASRGRARRRSTKVTKYKRPRSVTVQNPRRKRKKRVKVVWKDILVSVFGAVGAVLLTKLATQALAKAKAKGTAVPKLLADNVGLAAPVLGVVLLSMMKKKSPLGPVGMGLLIGGAAQWFAKWAASSAVFAGASGQLPDATIQSLGALAPRVTPAYAAKMLGLTSARPRVSRAQLGSLAIEPPPTDPSVDQALRQGITLGALEPGGLPTWSDRGTWGALEEYESSSFVDPHKGQFGPVSGWQGIGGMGF